MAGSRVQEFGAGPPVVLLHGLLGSADNWRPVAMRLAENFHVLAIDQLNHGSAPQVEAMDYSRMAADVASVLQAHGVNRAYVVGHSMGGKTAMQLALDFPEGVDRLVVADIAPRAYPQPQAAIIRALLALKLPSFTTRTQGRRRWLRRFRICFSAGFS
jgi:esterase